MERPIACSPQSKKSLKTRRAGITAEFGEWYARKRIQYSIPLAIFCSVFLSFFLGFLGVSSPKLSAITISDLPPEIQNLLGQPTDLECPCCLPHPNVTPQLVSDGTKVRAWKPAWIANAKRGHLIMVPSNGQGQIGALLESLQPPQHYSHMGIMTRNGTKIRHCTASADWLKQHANGILGYPTDGFYERAMRFGWPGTISQTIEAAWRSSRGDLDRRIVVSEDGSVKATLPDLHVEGPVWAPYLAQRSAPGEVIGEVVRVPNTNNDVTMMPFAIQAIGFDPVSVPILDSNYAQNTIFGNPGDALPPDRDANIQYKTMWPLVVKPCPLLTTPRVLAALDRIAAAAESLSGHYRFNGYVNAFIAEDPLKFGNPADFGGVWETEPLLDPNDPCKKIPVGLTRGMVCSTFVWEAVREANRVGHPHIWLTLPLDKNRPSGCTPFYIPPAGDRYNVTEDGLFDYPVNEIQRSALWFAAALRRDVDEQASSAPWWASPFESAFEFFTDIRDDVANQIGNTFAFDRCDPSYKDDNTWLSSPPPGTSCSPDNIIRSWASPTENGVDPENIYGIYGYNQQVVLRPGGFKDQFKTVWGFSEGPGIVKGLVRYKLMPVAGAEVDVFCHTAYTNSDGWFSLEVPAGLYLLNAGAYFPQPAGQPAWWAEAEEPVQIVFGQTTLLKIDLQDPPGENRMLIVQGSADCVNRHVIGHDWWGHPKFTCPIVYLGNYDTQGNSPPAGGYTTSWGYTIDGGWNTGIEVSATRIDQSSTNPADPYPLEVSVTFKLGSAGAGWPLHPEASDSKTVIIPTDGSKRIVADLDVGWIAPLRSHIEVELFNNRQG
jgi:hypothetical protein